MPEQTLAQRVRAKYPGEYDDLSDHELESKVLAKYPEYKDIPLTPKASSMPAVPSASTLGDVATGLLKSPVGAFVEAGKAIHKIPGVSSAVDYLYGTPGLSQQAFGEATQAVAPQNAAQSVGKFAGDVALTVAPSGAITRAGRAAAAMLPEAVPAAVRGLPVVGRAAAAATRLAPQVAVEAAGGAGLAAAQGGDPTTGAVLGGAVPVLGAAAGPIASRLKAAVPKQITQALDPRKEKYKALTEKIMPEIIRRGIKGSREAIQEQAGEEAAKAGQAIDTALQTKYGGQRVRTQPIQDALEAAKRKFVNLVEQPADALTPEAVKAAPSFIRPDATAGELFVEVLADAKRQGYKGSPSALKSLFDDAVRDARELAVDIGDDVSMQSPKGILKRIADLGGLRMDKGMPGELRQFLESRTAAGSSTSDRAILGAQRTGSVGGVGRVANSGGKSLDAMAEALRESGMDVEGPKDVLKLVEDARVALMRPGAEKGLGHHLQAVGVRPGTKWWDAADEGFDVAAMEAAPAATGPTMKSVITDARPVKQIAKLQRIIAEHGDDMTVDQLVGVRRVWDDVVAQAGGFAHRAPGAIGIPLKEQTEAWAKRKATTAIRQLLDQEVPDLSALNKEFSFWKNLDDIVTATQRRRAPYQQGLGSTAMEGAGRVIGGLAGASHGPAGALGGAWALGKISKMARAAFTSPRWLTTSAHLKDQLADAIMSGRTDKAATIFARIMAVQTSKVGAQ